MECCQKYLREMKTERKSAVVYFRIYFNMKAKFRLEFSRSFLAAWLKERKATFACETPKRHQHGCGVWMNTCAGVEHILQKASDTIELHLLIWWISGVESSTRAREPPMIFIPLDHRKPFSRRKLIEFLMTCRLNFFFQVSFNFKLKTNITNVSRDWNWIFGK